MHPRLLIGKLVRGWLLSVIVFGALAAAPISQFAFNSTSTFSWWEAGRGALRDWGAWALFAPVIFQVVAALPLFNGRWKIAVPVHLLLTAGVFVFSTWWGESVLPRRPQGRGGFRPPSRYAGTRGERPPVEDAAPPSSTETPRLTQQMREGEGLPSSPAAEQPATLPQRERPFRGGPPPPGPRPFWRQVVFVATFRLPIYLAILSVAHALLFYRRGRARELRAVELESGLTRARLDALRMQLQPHFLFNSLNAIAALIHKDPERADEMVASLSDFLRLTLERPAEQELPLKREMEFVERYLAIEKVRFGERLLVSFDIPPETYTALVPTLMLQPLVENAVRHGLEPKIEGGKLTITARREEQRLILSVVDNGAGLNEPKPREGIGLHNTRTRLGELYGARATLDLLGNGGVEVRISLPFHTAPAAQPALAA